MRRALARWAVMGAGALVWAALPGRAGAEGVLVFAAASLTNVLDRIGAAWTARSGHAVVLSYAGSSALARQIQAGAPADVFISASRDWIEALVASGDVQPASVRDVAGNRLVLIAHGSQAAPVVLDRDLDLAALLGDGRLSMALVDAVPAGIYGRQALASLGLWDDVAPVVAQSDNVRTALAFVAQGEAPLGIVYATDAAVQDNVTVIATFPPDSHAPIRYPAALTTHSASPVAQDFLAFLTAPPAQAIWAEFGFVTGP